MKTYIGTKIIQAMKATNIESAAKVADCPVETQKSIFAKSGVKEREGYHVRYPDGYQSWSPKDVFEEAYRECDNMTFGLAIEAMKKGKRVARKGWNGKNQYIELATCISYKNVSGEIVNVEHDAIGNQAIAFIGTSGVQIGWLASQADMLAEDWVIVE